MNKFKYLFISIALISSVLPAMQNPNPGEDQETFQALLQLTREQIALLRFMLESDPNNGQPGSSSSRSRSLETLRDKELASRWQEEEVAKELQRRTQCAEDMKYARQLQLNPELNEEDAQARQQREILACIHKKQEQEQRDAEFARQLARNQQGSDEEENPEQWEYFEWLIEQLDTESPRQLNQHDSDDEEENGIEVGSDQASQINRYLISAHHFSWIGTRQESALQLIEVVCNKYNMFNRDQVAKMLNILHFTKKIDSLIERSINCERLIFQNTSFTPQDSLRCSGEYETLILRGSRQNHEQVLREALQHDITPSKNKESSENEKNKEREEQNKEIESECPICCENYTQEGERKPFKSAICQHIICETCIASLKITSNGSVKCPFCRRSHYETPREQ